MIEEWKRQREAGIKLDDEFPGPDGPPGVSMGNSPPTTADSPTHLIAFLASCDSPEAIRAFAENWSDLPMLARREIVDRARERDFGTASDIAEAVGLATQAVIEDVLLNALADTVDFPGETHLGDSGAFFDPRLCDLAADALQRHWPAKYHFDITAPFVTRERQRLECRNVRLREMGIDQLPLPPLRPKLPRTEGNRIVAIEWADRSAKPTGAFAERLHTLERKTLSGKMLVTVLTSFAAKPPQGLRALHLRAERADDLTGVVLTLWLVAGEAHPRSHCATSDRVLRGRVSKHESSHNGMAEHAAKPAGWEDFRKAAEAALAEPVEEAATMVASVAFE